YPQCQGLGAPVGPMARGSGQAHRAADPAAGSTQWLHRLRLSFPVRCVTPWTNWRKKAAVPVWWTRTEPGSPFPALALQNTLLVLLVENREQTPADPDHADLPGAI